MSSFQPTFLQLVPELVLAACGGCGYETHSKKRRIVKKLCLRIKIAVSEDEEFFVCDSM